MRQEEDEILLNYQRIENLDVGHITYTNIDYFANSVLSNFDINSTVLSCKSIC